MLSQHNCLALSCQHNFCQQFISCIKQCYPPPRYNCWRYLYLQPCIVYLFPFHLFSKNRSISLLVHFDIIMYYYCYFFFYSPGQPSLPCSVCAWPLGSILPIRYPEERTVHDGTEVKNKLSTGFFFDWFFFK